MTTDSGAEYLNNTDPQEILRFIFSPTSGTQAMSLVLRGWTYAYGGGQDEVLNNLTVEIREHQRAGRTLRKRDRGRGGKERDRSPV